MPARAGLAPDPQTVVFARQATDTQSFGALAQRFGLTLLGMIVAVVCLVTAVANFRFASTWGDGAARAVAIILAVAADFLKCGLPLAIYSTRDREAGITVIAKAICVVCFAVSTICGLGWAVMLGGGQAETIAELSNQVKSTVLLAISLLLAQFVSTFGPLIVVAASRYAKDMPDELPMREEPSTDMVPSGSGDEGYANWFSAMVGRDRPGKVYLKDAYDEYVKWATQGGYPLLPKAEVSRALEDHIAMRGLTKGRDRDVFFPGISLAKPDELVRLN